MRSASPFSEAATRKRWAALISFIACFDFCVRLDVGHERLDDAVAEFVHGMRKFALDGVGDLVLFLEGVVELHARHPCPHDVIDIRGNLRAGVLQLVIGRSRLYRAFTRYCTDTVRWTKTLSSVLVSTFTSS